MENRLSYVVAFVYTLGVLVTGIWAADPTFPRFTPLRIAILGGLAVAWTAYFGWRVGPRLVDLETGDEDEDEDENRNEGQGERLDPTQA